VYDDIFVSRAYVPTTINSLQWWVRRTWLVYERNNYNTSLYTAQRDLQNCIHYAHIYTHVHIREEEYDESSCLKSRLNTAAVSEWYTIVYSYNAIIKPLPPRRDAHILYISTIRQGVIIFWPKSRDSCWTHLWRDGIVWAPRVVGKIKINPLFWPLCRTLSRRGTSSSLRQSFDCVITTTYVAI